MEVLSVEVGLGPTSRWCVKNAMTPTWPHPRAALGVQNEHEEDTVDMPDGRPLSPLLASWWSSSRKKGNS